MREHNRVLPDQYQNMFSPKYPHFWRKLLIGRQVIFELRRRIEHCNVCQVSLEIRQLINEHSFVYHSNISPSDIFCIGGEIKSLTSYES